MSRPKHTPGPWCIDWNVSRLDVFSGDGATLVATIRRSSLSSGIDDAAKANARLIAAAPDLLELVLDALDDPDVDILGSEWVRDARAAIAKATGGQP